MRPAGDVRQALIQAAREVVAELGQQDSAGGRRGATLAELAARACVGRDAAHTHVPKLKSRGHLQIVGERRVDYRNRPVAEYAPVDVDAPLVEQGWVDLGKCMADWVR